MDGALPASNPEREMRNVLTNEHGDFRFADWDSSRGTVPAYYVQSSGVITVGEAAVVDGKLWCNSREIVDDGRTERLVGWRHDVCQSFDDGSILIPLKGSRA